MRYSQVVISNTRLNVGASFYTSLGILSFPVWFVKGKKTFLNNPKLFLSFFFESFFYLLFLLPKPPVYFSRRRLVLFGCFT